MTLKLDLLQFSIKILHCLITSKNLILLLPPKVMGRDNQVSCTLDDDIRCFILWYIPIELDDIWCPYVNPSGAETGVFGITRSVSWLLMFQFVSSSAAATMMTSSNRNISASLAICAGNSPVTGEFPAQRPVMRSFEVFFDLWLNRRLSKQSWGWWFETPSPPLWRQCNDIDCVG